MTYSHILWDFNGTILNDVEAGINSANVLLARRNMRTIDSVESYHKLFCFPIKKYYKNLGFELEKEIFENVAIEWMEQYLYFSKQSQIFKNVIESMDYLKALQIPQIILSATEKQMLISQLSELCLDNYFDEVLGLDNIHAYSKIQIAKEWMERVKPKKAVLLGDTVHDFEVATEMGIDCILIANGHQSKEILKTCGVSVFDNIGEFMKSGVI